jgi:hypothetical protein
MAFNFRPKNAIEITRKKKSNSATAAVIYTAIMEEYGEGIILDPTTSFGKIKVPRAVGEKKTITQVKQFLKSKRSIDLKGIELSFGDGSGVGKGTDATATAKQENATRLYCQTYMDTKKFPTAVATKKVYPEVDDAWYATFEAQAISIVKWIKAGGYEFSRDDGIMPFLEDIAIKKCGVRTKDSWNPADIYAVRKSKKRVIMKELDAIGDLKMEPAAKLDALNSYMSSRINSKDLIGISLKKLSKGKVQTIELTNASKKDKLTDIAIVPHSILLDLDLNKDKEFITGEMSFKIIVKKEVVNVQIRAFSGSVRESTQMDMTGSGAAAKLGKVSSREAIDPFLTKVGAPKRRMGTDLPKVGAWTKKDVDAYVKEQKELEKIKIDKHKIYWGKTTWKTTLNKAIEYEQDISRTASQLSAKLQCFQWVKIFNHIEKKGKLQEFLTVLYYGAKKQYDTAGPFLKIA